MIKTIFGILLLITANSGFAQYLHYSDKSTKNSNISPAKPVQDSVVYHEWPDRCPGQSGSIPVLTSYVPRELVLRLTEIYKGHLYSISSIRTANNKPGYKLSVCVKGEIKFEYADEAGNIISK